MISFICDLLEKDLRTVDTLRPSSTEFLEFELRFGQTSSTVFNPCLPLPVFQKIFKYFFVDERIQQQIIIDTILNDTTVDKRNNRGMKKIKKVSWMKEVDNDDNVLSPVASLISNCENLVTSQPEINVQYFESKKKRNTATIDNLRYSYNLEKEINYNAISKLRLTPKYHRIKKRYSKRLFDQIRLDMTIINTVTVNNNVSAKQQPKNVTYIIELELLKCSKNTQQLIHYVRQAITQIYDLYFDLYDFFMFKAVVNPVTITKNDLSLLTTQQYCVTTKTDGYRALLIFYKNRIFLQSPNNVEREILLEISNDTGLDYTIIDGEYVSTMNKFIAFDILTYENTHITPQEKQKSISTLVTDSRFISFQDRLKKLKSIESELKKVTKFDICIKEFWFPEDTDIFQKSLNLHCARQNSPTDGLIYQPIDSYYLAAQPINYHNHHEIVYTLPILKWKKDISIDVRVEYIPSRHCTFFHHGSGKGKFWYTKQKPSPKDAGKQIRHSRWVTSLPLLTNQIISSNLGFKMSDNMAVLGKPGFPSTVHKVQNKYDVVEYRLDSDTKQWIMIRKRLDKKRPNGYTTIKKNLEAMINPVTIGDIAGLSNEENIMKKKDVDYNSLVLDSYQNRKTWRVFNNFAKNQLYRSVSTKISKQPIDVKFKKRYLLDIACGKFGDLNKWIANGFTDILAIDISNCSIEVARKRLVSNGFKKISSYWQKGEMKITVIEGDVCKDIRSGAAGTYETDQRKIYNFFSDPEFGGFHAVSCMFAIHYFHGACVDGVWYADKERTSTFYRNVGSLLRNNGYFFGIFLSSDSITEDIMEFSDSENDVIYKIEKRKLKENEDALPTIEVTNECWTSKEKNDTSLSTSEKKTTICDMTMSEPSINMDDIAKQLPSNYKLLSSRSISVYEDMFVAKNVYNKELCFLNEEFMFQKI